MEAAIAQAQNDGILSGSSVLSVIDPGRYARVDPSAVVANLGLSLSFSSGNDVTDSQIISRVTHTFGSIPALTDIIWPVANESTPIPISELDIESIEDQFQMNLGKVLSLIQGVNQSDASVFLSLAGEGDFTVPYKHVPRVTKANLTQALDTYLVTAAWAQNNWTALILPGVDAFGLGNGTARCPAWASDGCIESPDIGCYLDYDSYGECPDALWWYSAS